MTNNLVSDNGELQLAEEQEEEAYVEYDIATYPSDNTLDGLQQMYSRGDIIVPAFQRRYVWKIEQASLLVESFLLGLPVPPLFLYVNEDNKAEVIDGQQRLLSMMYYLEGYFGESDTKGKRQIFKLKGLSERSPFKSKRFTDLDDKFQRKLRSSVLRAINIRQLSPSDNSTSVYHIFERLNTGGTRLQPQEIRNVVYRGRIVDEIRSLNGLRAWRNILGVDTEDKFQRDVELVLRVFSLYRQWQGYEKPMKEWLSKRMAANRDFSSDVAKSFKVQFPKALDVVEKGLGSRPFRPKKVINTAILESILVSVMENPAITPKILSSKYNDVLSDKDYLSTLERATTDTRTVKERLSRAAKILLG